MFTTTVSPRFGDMDLLGHINNTVIAAWFEFARNPLIRIFDPGLELKRESFPLTIAHTDYDFLDQIYFQNDVEIRTWIKKIGNKSFTAYHEAWQKERLCVRGSAVMVHFDFISGKTTSIPEDRKKLLAEHMLN